MYGRTKTRRCSRLTHWWQHGHIESGKHGTSPPNLREEGIIWFYRLLVWWCSPHMISLFLFIGKPLKMLPFRWMKYITQIIFFRNCIKSKLESLQCMTVIWWTLQLNLNNFLLVWFLFSYIVRLFSLAQKVIHILRIENSNSDYIFL